MSSDEHILKIFNDSPGLKMLFIKGKLFKTNFKMEDNEFEYYRLIGEAYNSHILDRAIVSEK